MSFRILNTRDLQEERAVLIDTLAAYKQQRAHAVTVVFDGTRAPFDLARQETVKGIEVVFSPAGKTADAVIKKMAAREKEKALIVSSDREIADFAEARGATVISSELFENRIDRLLDPSEEGPPPETEDDAIPFVTTKKKGPSFRLSKKQRKARQKIQKL